FLATSSAAICAANGVDLREPLKPWAPADDQAIVLPCASVMVIIVLLKVEFTWAVPDEMFLRSRRRTRPASLAMYYLSIDLTRRRNASGYTREAVGSRQWAVGLDPDCVLPMPTALFLLAGNRLSRTLAGAGVGVRALAADRQVAAVAQA